MIYQRCAARTCSTNTFLPITCMPRLKALAITNRAFEHRIKGCLARHWFAQALALDGSTLDTIHSFGNFLRSVKQDFDAAEEMCVVTAAR